MSSYNKINGILASENRWLLKDVLRQEWGFDGFVMTDWWAEEDALVGGSGSGHVNRAYEVSIYEGLHQAGFRLDEESSKHYIDYVEAEKAKQNREFFWVVPTIDELAVSQEEAEAL